MAAPLLPPAGLLDRGAGQAGRHRAATGGPLRRRAGGRGPPAPAGACHTGDVAPDGAQVTAEDGLRFDVLGPLRLERHGRPVVPGPPLQRALLAILVLDAGHLVPVDRLVDLMWREGPPAAAMASLQAYVSQLRRVLEPGRPPCAPAQVLVTEDPG